jgi:predicted nuclease of restriction endonuclease-like (RecB) superfamily
MGNNVIANTQYREWLKELKQKVRKAQLKAAVSVNTALLTFYWEFGADIVEKQKNAKWGSGFLKRLSADLMAEFPDMKGFSHNNLQYIKRWYLFYSRDITNCGTGCSTIAQQPVAQLLEPDALQKVERLVPHPNWPQAVDKLVQIPWGHNLVIISKCKDVAEALFYVWQTIENNWSRNVLTHQIESGLYERQGKAITNFDKTLPAPQSDLAQQIIKDPYNFDFLTLTENYKERELEQGLIRHVTRFLIELGAGFAYMGKQVPLQVGERDFFLDLLFYHTKLHCYVVIELKTGDFEPEFAGKLNFYIKAVDEQRRQKGDNDTIGILLCKKKDKLVAEYALSDINKPMGVSEYQLTQALPDNLKSSLPSIEEIEAEFSGDLDHE